MLSLEEYEELLELSYKWCSQFFTQIQQNGYRSEHTYLVLSYIKLLQDAVNQVEIVDGRSIDMIKKMLE
jgi:hypothetical protein